MTEELDLILNGYRLEFAAITQEMKHLRADLLKEKTTDSLPEWIDLRRAVELKGGPAYETYRTKYFLQPCCGRNSKLIGGRKCWPRDEVIQWLAITDSGLLEYAGTYKVSIPENYAKRSK
jgi:hypothetical protein